MTIARSSIAAWFALALLAFWGDCFWGSAPACGQVLQQLGEEVRNGVPGTNPASSPPPASSGPTPNRNSASQCDSDDSAEDELYGDLFLAGAAIVTSPYWVPVSALGDDPLMPGYFLRYPYWRDMPGSMYPTDALTPRHRPWSGEFSFEYSNDFDDLSRLGAHLRISTTSRFDFETNWNTFTEETPTGRDHLSLGNFEVLYRFAESDWLQFRSGLGANWLADHQGTDGGFNFRYGVECYPGRPWTIKALVDAGELGRVDLIHVRATVGASLQRWELYTGYDFLRVGTVQISGPVAGVLVRF